MGFSDGSVVKILLADAGDAGLSLGQKDLLQKGIVTHSSIFPGKSHGQRSLVGRSS